MWLGAYVRFKMLHYEMKLEDNLQICWLVSNSDKLGNFSIVSIKMCTFIFQNNQVYCCYPLTNIFVNYHQVSFLNTTFWIWNRHLTTWQMWLFYFFVVIDKFVSFHSFTLRQLGQCKLNLRAIATCFKWQARLQPECTNCIITCQITSSNCNLTCYS